MFWGRMVEEAIANGVKEKKGWIVEMPGGYYTCDDMPGMGCTPDRVISGHPHKPGRGLMQIKNVDWLEFKKWEENPEGGKIPPMAKQLQLQHELACAGFEWGVLAVLVGGNDLKLYEYDAHAGAIAKIKSTITKFWEAVQSGDEPVAEASDYEVLKELYPNDENKTIDLSMDNELPSLCATALEAAERRKAAEKEEKAAKAQVLQKMGDASRATCSGFVIKKTTVRKKEYIVKASEYNQLTIKEGL